MNSPSLRDSLSNEILLARQRVYAAREPTPLERLDAGLPAEVWVKREDRPPIHAYNLTRPRHAGKGSVFRAVNP